MSDKVIEKKTEKEEPLNAPKNITTCNPEKPLYSRQHLCIYLRELYDLAEQEQETSEKEKNNKENQ